eukprot:scaffold318519_cov19-Tisochrysis_lutea.AAC.1
MVHGLIHSTFDGFLKTVYGNVAFQQTVASQPGDAQAGEAQEGTGCPRQFEDKCPYADSLFFSTSHVLLPSRSHVRSTASVVHVSEEEVLHQYGRYFLQNAAEQ